MSSISINIQESNLMSEHRFAIIVSQFNQSITQKLLQGSLDYLHESGIATQQIQIVQVPGAVEIPLVAQLLAKSQHYHALICLGAVIRGETSHYDYVCKQVSDGCQRVMLDFEVPVIFGVLTTENEEQAYERAGGKAGHKGREAAETAIEMLAILDQIKTTLKN